MFNFILAIALVFTAGGTEPYVLASVPDRAPVLTFPHDGDGRTEFANTWGARRPGGRRHRGTDLMAPKMTPVVAAADGVVETVRESRRAGRYVVIVHDGGWETWYLHLNNDTPGTDDGRADWSDTVAEGIGPGTFVRAGQLIGYVGDSGNAERTGSHTHFELHDDGKRVNPYPYLTDAWTVYQAELEERAHADTVDAIEEATFELE